MSTSKMKKRVLLTGATGFIGRNCIPFLKTEGYDIHAISSRGIGEANAEACVWHQIDLLDQQKTSSFVHEIRPTHLLHFAWYAEPGKYATSEQNLVWLRASLNLLESFGAASGKRVVMAGTCFEYDWNYGYCSEGFTPLRPSTPYGACKHSLQQVLGMLPTEFNVSSAWGRIFWLYGPYEHPRRLTPHIIVSLLKGQRARCNSGGLIRDFLYVQDVAEAFVALLESSVVGAVNIGSGHPISLEVFVRAIARAVGPEDLLDIGCDMPEREPPFLVAQTRRLIQEVGWCQRHTLEEGLAKTVSWWKWKERGIGDADND